MGDFCHVDHLLCSTFLPSLSFELTELNTLAFGNLMYLLFYTHQALELQEPLSRLNVIHVAGTKGKGSTCAFTESILRSRGYRTGLFTSPHLVDIRERFRFNGDLVSEEVFAKNFWWCWKRLECNYYGETQINTITRVLKHLTGIGIANHCLGCEKILLLHKEELAREQFSAISSAPSRRSSMSQDALQDALLGDLGDIRWDGDMSFGQQTTVPSKAGTSRKRAWVQSHDEEGSGTTNLQLPPLH
ncbi:hypothetical protein L7F22_055735 [Adiantum nelumboides]|nr:hypothetical protein [Adiantum nelumboides]